MQRNRIVTGALLGALVIVAVSCGFVIAQLTSPTSASSPTGGPSPMSGTGEYSNSSLAHYIAQQAGTRLAGTAPQNVPASQVRALSEQVPAGASVDRNASTITFTRTAVSLTIVAIAPGAPDMTFRIAGLANPTIVVPPGANVTVRFVNNDPDEAHGWLITTNQPPFGFGQSATPAISGAKSGVIGDPTSAGDGANTFSFAVGASGSYQYICPMPGHAQMGMHGSFLVR